MPEGFGDSGDQGRAPLAAVRTSLHAIVGALAAAGLGGGAGVAAGLTGPSLWLAPVLCLAVAAVGCLTALHRLREVATALERRTADLQALLDGGPPLALWRHGTAVEAPPDLVSRSLGIVLGGDPGQGPEALGACFAGSDAQRVAIGLTALRRDGEAVDLEATPRQGGRLRITGLRLPWVADAPGADVIWLADLGAITGRLERLSRRLADRQALLDQLPVPVWLRGPDLEITWCNSAFQEALEASAEAIRHDRRELAAGEMGARKARAFSEQVLAAREPRSELRRVIIRNSRRVMQVTERPVGDGRLLGLAIDRTVEDEVRAELDRHVAAHAAVLEQLGSAIAIYGPDRRLRFFNQAYLRLWGLDEARLAQAPSFAEVLEELRTLRRLPETANFPYYKREQMALFTTLIEPREDLMHLPDGTTLRSLAVPHPFGGIMFVLEDVTNALELESSYNTLVAVQKETLDNLAEGIAVFGGDGRLKLSNPAYAAIWNLEPEMVTHEPHITGLVDRMRDYFDYGGDWEGVRTDMVAATLERSLRTGRITRVDGSVIEFSNVPLPDGAVLTTFLDVSDSVRVEKALRAANAALEAADALKIGLLANISYHLRTPLTTIMGYSEMLAQEYFGPLNDRQKDTIRSVLGSGEELVAIVNDILDLSAIEAGYFALDRRPVPVQPLLNRILGMTRSWAEQKSLRVTVDCPSDLAPIYGDDKRLRQILLNLVGLAVRFPPPGGDIALTARMDACAQTISVGITMNDRCEVGPDWHSPLNLIVRTPTVEPRLSGIGLTLVRKLVEQHGGRVEIVPGSDRRIEVRCILPAATEQSVPADDPEPPPATLETDRPRHL